MEFTATSPLVVSTEPLLGWRSEPKLGPWLGWCALVPGGGSVATSKGILDQGKEVNKKMQKNIRRAIKMRFKALNLSGLLGKEASIRKLS